MGTPRTPTHIHPTITRLGTLEYLDMCNRALVKQRRRLKAAGRGVQPSAEPEAAIERGRRLFPDVWLTLVALTGSLQAIKLAGSVSSSNGAAIRALGNRLSRQDAIVRARNVYVHLDEYLRGVGNIQKSWRKRNKAERADMHLPQVLTLTSDRGTIKGVEVRIGADAWVDLFAAISATTAAIGRAIELLESE
jgi:hypothetical protein